MNIEGFGFDTPSWDLDHEETKCSVWNGKSVEFLDQRALHQKRILDEFLEKTMSGNDGNQIFRFNSLLNKTSDVYAQKCSGLTLLENSHALCLNHHASVGSWTRPKDLFTFYMCNKVGCRFFFPHAYQTLNRGRDPFWDVDPYTWIPKP